MNRRKQGEGTRLDDATHENQRVQDTRNGKRYQNQITADNVARITKNLAAKQIKGIVRPRTSHIQVDFIGFHLYVRGVWYMWL